MTGKCPICSSTPSPPNIITCSACQLSFHPTCVQLLPSDIDYIKEICKKWQCSACIQTGRKHRSGSVSSAASRQQDSGADSGCRQTTIEENFSRLFGELTNIRSIQQSMYDDISFIKESHAQLRDDINSRYTQLHEELVACDSRLAKHDAALSKHADAFQSIDARLSKIESALVDNTSAGAGCLSGSQVGTASVCAGVQGMDEIMAEFGERQRRARNLMIFGVPEGPGGSEAERKAADESYVAEMFSCLDVHPTASGISRVGKLGEGKIRPIKVTLPSEDQVAVILRRVRKLRDRAVYERVRVSFDQTPRQQQHYRSLKAQLAVRLANGESNLKIRHVSGIPTIVSLN